MRSPRPPFPPPPMPDPWVSGSSSAPCGTSLPQPERKSEMTMAMLKTHDAFTKCPQSNDALDVWPLPQETATGVPLAFQGEKTSTPVERLGVDTERTLKGLKTDGRLWLKRENGIDSRLTQAVLSYCRQT